MDKGPGSPHPHLRVQLSLLGSSRVAPSSRAARFSSMLRVGTRNFPAEIYPAEPLLPGGHAVHCEVVLADAAEALPHLPAGAMFELWEKGRCGYGMVLGVVQVR